MANESCFYIVEGAALPLRRLRSARLVVPAKNDHHHHVAARLARSSRLALMTAVPKDTLVVHGDEAKLDDIRHYPDVHCTRSAFLDAAGHLLYLTDDVLVRFTSTLNDASRRELCRRFGCVVIDDSRDIWRLRVLDTDDDAPLDVANNLSEERGVEFAEPNALQAATYAATFMPEESLFENQWHLHNTGQAGGVAGADIRALEAWAISTGSADIRVVVHDSGVDIHHPDLRANIDPGRDFDHNDNDASNQFGPHGTACAGVLAAVRNDQGVVGIAPGCRIVPLRAASAHTWSMWAETFDWATAHGDIISCSWTLSPNNTLSDAIRRAARQGREGMGIPIFCATGNDRLDVIGYPANLPATIAIGASTNQDVRADYSQYGPGIDFVAPSSGGTLRIETTDVQGFFGYNRDRGGDYCKATDHTGFGGTSAATSLAAGVAALMLSVNNHLTAEEGRAIIRDTCDRIDPAHANYDARGWSPQYGYGRINAAAAVKRAQDLGRGSKV